jgi:hypothetical protein
MALAGFFISGAGEFAGAIVAAGNSIAGSDNTSKVVSGSSTA